MNDYNEQRGRQADDLFSSLDLSEDTPLSRRENTESRGTQKKVKRELNTAVEPAARRASAGAKPVKKKSNVKKIIFWSVLELFTLAAIFVYGYFLRSWNLIARPEVNESVIENHNLSAEKIAQMEQGYWTFAVFGVDGRSASDLVSKGLNSDVVLIVSINQDTGEIRMCSVFRDTYLNISEDNRYRKINQAYSEGGPEQALAAINKNLDLNIRNYVTFNWKAVADGINILGGIDGIDISKAELYYINAFITETVNVTKIGSHQLTSTGPQHLDGVQAVAYGRLRLMDNDYARTERQKKVIKASFEKAKTAGFSVLNNIMVVCFPEVATNINFNTVVAMAQDITKYNITESGGFPWQRSEAGVGSLGDVVVPATLESNVRYLHKFLFDDENYEPSQAVMNYSGYIKDRTGIYKEGQVVESVRTDGGLISKPRPAETEQGSAGAGSEGETSHETDAEGNEIEPVEYETDDDGNIIWFTDDDGNIIIPTDANGEYIYPTDEDGENIYPTDEDGNELMPENRPGPVNNRESQAGPGGEASHGDDTPGGTEGPGGTLGPGGETAAEQETTEHAPGNGTGNGEKSTENTAGPGGNNTAGGPGAEGPGSQGNSNENTQGGPGSQSSQGNSQGGPGSQQSSGNNQGGPGSGQTGPGGQSSQGNSQGGPGSQSSQGNNQSGPGGQSSQGSNQGGPGSQSSQQNSQQGPGGSSSQGGPGGDGPGNAPIG